MSRCTSGSENLRPIKRLTEKIVSLGLTTDWRLATRQTIFLRGLTTEGIIFSPSAEWMTLGFPPSITATHELVVPKSIPIILAICLYLLLYHLPNYYLSRP